MRLRWTPDAADDLEAIHSYLTRHRPALAHSTMVKLYDGVVSLKRSPHKGRPGREAGTRELVFAPLPYIAVYRIVEQTIEVLHFYHGAQDRP